MSAPHLTSSGDRNVECAAPELLAAARLARSALQAQLDALLEIGCDRPCGEPVRSTLAPELVDDVVQLEEAIEAVDLAELKASAPWDELRAEQQAAIIQRFPPPLLTEAALG